MGYCHGGFPLGGPVGGRGPGFVGMPRPQMGFSTRVAGSGGRHLPGGQLRGIHLDGFCDVSDALASHVSREKSWKL